MDAKERRLEDLTELQNAHLELRSNPHYAAVRRTQERMLNDLRLELEESDPYQPGESFTIEVRNRLVEIRLLKKLIGKPGEIRTQIDGMLHPPGPIIHRGER